MIMRQFQYFVKIILISLILVSSNKIVGQIIPPPEQPHNFWENVRFGGGIGLGFGDGFFSGTLAPSAIYQFNPQFAVGVGLSGTYNKQKNRYTSTILGGSIMTFYNVIPEIQLSAEFEELNVTRRWEIDGANVRDHYWYPALFLGAGFRTRNVTIGIRYDVLYDKNKSVYGQPYGPFVRVYF